jgi:hypothetical protein
MKEITALRGLGGGDIHCAQDIELAKAGCAEYNDELTVDIIEQFDVIYTAVQTGL